MSQPVTDEEKARARDTEGQAGVSENLVSTACPACNTRFSTLARFGCVEGSDDPVWSLRCVNCGVTGIGHLK